MTDAKQYCEILRVSKETHELLKKLKTDIHTLISIQGATTAELNMLKERFDIATNAEFLKDNPLVDKNGHR